MIVPKTCELQCRCVRLIRGETDKTGRPYYGRALASVREPLRVVPVTQPVGLRVRLSEWAELVDAICLHSDCWVRDHPTGEPPYYCVESIPGGFLALDYPGQCRPVSIALTVLRYCPGYYPPHSLL